MELRIAFCGASGTGKTTLATHLAETKGLALNPVGSRSVAKGMGYDNPYDVDKDGRRAEFQERLVTEKRAWENVHESFVVDRTTIDNLVYTIFHDVYAVNSALLKEIAAGMERYTHIIYCPSDVFIKHGGDTNRVDSSVYHKLYDITIQGFLREYRNPMTRLLTLTSDDLEQRKREVEMFTP